MNEWYSGYVTEDDPPKELKAPKTSNPGLEYHLHYLVMVLLWEDLSWIWEEDQEPVPSQEKLGPLMEVAPEQSQIILWSGVQHTNFYFKEVRLDRIKVWESSCDS